MALPHHAVLAFSARRTHDTKHVPSQSPLEDRPSALHDVPGPYPADPDRLPFGELGAGPPRGLKKRHYRQAAMEVLGALRDFDRRCCSAKYGIIHPTAYIWA